MRPVYTKILCLDASYEDILANLFVHTELKKMCEIVLQQKSFCFFIYKGTSDEALVVFNYAGSVRAHVCTCPIVCRNFESKPDLIYILCYNAS